VWNLVGQKWLGQNVHLTPTHGSAVLSLISYILILRSAGVEPRQS